MESLKNIRKLIVIIIISVIVVVSAIGGIVLFKMSKKEKQIGNIEPYLEINQTKNIINNDETFRVKQAISIQNEEINMFFGAVDSTLSYIKKIKLIVKLKDVYDNLEYYNEINNIDILEIPEGAQYEGIDNIQEYIKNIKKEIKTLDRIDIGVIDVSELIEVLSNVDSISEYTWIRKYSIGFSETKYIEYNIIIKINNKIIHSKVTKCEDKCLIRNEILLYLV